MKHILALLLALCLLCGCAQVPPEPVATTEAAVTTAATTPEGFYDPDSALQQQYPEGIRVYPLDLTDAYGLKAFRDGLLLFSGDDYTTLTVLRGDDLYPAAQLQLEFFLSAADPSLVVCREELSFFDPVRRETVVLDGRLHTVRHIAAPEDLTGKPVLSKDRNTLYYCTANALRAWDLESGIRRVLKEMAYPEQAVAGLHWGDQIIHCKAEDSNLFLSAENGSLVEEQKQDLTLQSDANLFCAALQLGLNSVLVYHCNGFPQILLPENMTGEFCFLDSGLSAIYLTEDSDQNVTLEYFNLTNGQKTSVLPFALLQAPAAVAQSVDGFVYILTYDSSYGCYTLYRWDTVELATNDTSVYSSKYLTSEYPLPEEQTRCREYAAELSRKFGVEILIGQDACENQPWDYVLEPEKQPALIMRELTRLEQQLSHYPKEVLEQTASNFTSLKLCLVRSVTGSAQSRSLTSATGVQFLIGTDSYVAIAMGRYARQALYHELFHVMETQIFNNSIAFDQWEKLNPAGFEYDYGYAANQDRDSGVYLQWEHRAFIDTYSMSFPKEDRARIFEYAMLEESKELFQTPALQAKLQALCSGIREAYGLEESEARFLWEQHLAD